MSYQSMSREPDLTESQAFGLLKKFAMTKPKTSQRCVKKNTPWRWAVNDVNVEIANDGTFARPMASRESSPRVAPKNSRATNDTYGTWMDLQ